MRAKVLSSLRRLARLHPLIADLLFAVVVTGVALAFATAFDHAASDPGYAHRHLDALGLALTVAGNLVLAGWRRAPLAVLLITCAAEVVFHAAGYDARLNSWGPLLALYMLACLRPPAVSVPCALLVAACWWHAAFLAPGDFTWPNVIQVSVMTAGAWTIGNGTRILLARNQRLAELTERLRRSQEDRARRAVTEERVRIARELHDVVAHHMSVIVIQAGLARYVFSSDPATARGALATIADTGSEAMGEMRRLLAVLRIDTNGHGDDDSYDPAPTLERLGQLVERVRSAGVPVEVTVTGSVRPLPPGIDLCAYRILQECLTNVLKHAAPATAKVHLHYGADLELRVTDDGPGPGAPKENGGHGLPGMRERVKLYKGVITAGPGPSGGFEVVVSLPLTSPGTAEQRP
ncbi:sensor histidine kinase [Actinomadura sp. ATCC 31491]|uniref:histidine kinase n=1 Tax=Actinomadura luzonensis TaxID=2805427 RepID=A0ABT0G190_9ACTN|nr:sensor histidine kinase [Actinomadura luzonensis]MCK2218348.1 sensor histidine kinase [Actinomadura luzonensis]